MGEEGLASDGERMVVEREIENDVNEGKTGEAGEGKGEEHANRPGAVGPAESADDDEENEPAGDGKEAEAEKCAESENEAGEEGRQRTLKAPGEVCQPEGGGGEGEQEQVRRGAKQEQGGNRAGKQRGVERDAVKHKVGGEEVDRDDAECAQEGEEAAVVGYPIFIGLNVGNEGLSFRCFTVNVQNSADEAFLNFLESDVAKAGLKLTTFAQPALEPLVKLVMGMTKIVAQRHQNVPVQDIYLGLDFGENAMGARLAVGDYIAVQIPENFTSIWDWNDWVYDPGNGHIVSKADPDKLIPYNYIVFGVSRYEGE